MILFCERMKASNKMKSKIIDELKLIFFIFFVAVFVLALLYELFPSIFPKWVFWTVFTIQGSAIIGLVSLYFINRSQRKLKKSFKIERWSYGKINTFWASWKVPKKWMDTFTEEEWAYVRRMGRYGPDAIFEILEKKGYYVDKFWKELENVNELFG